MAAPTPLTLTTLVAEALKKAGQTSPLAALVDRAEDYWMEEIKNDIWMGSNKGRLKSLYTSIITVLVDGKARYSVPTDFSADMTMEIADGAHRDTAQAATASNITLAATEDATDIVGSEIFIRSASTGAGSYSNITAYNSTTKVATISPNWQITPTGTITYTIIDVFYPLRQVPVFNKPASIERGIPREWYPVGDSDYGEFILFPVPYQSDAHVMGVIQRYFANLMTLDLAGTLMGTLYNNWKQVFTLGIKYKALDELNDKRSEQAYQEYQRALAAMISRELYGMDMSNLQTRVCDY